jgi:hypothetical protein
MDARGMTTSLRARDIELLACWFRAEAEARTAYDEWARSRDADSYAAYRASADRADAAQDALALFVR